MVLGEGSAKEQQGPRSHKIVDPTLNDRKEDDIQIQVQGLFFMIKRSSLILAYTFFDPVGRHYNESTTTTPSSPLSSSPPVIIMIK